MSLARRISQFSDPYQWLFRATEKVHPQWLWQRSSALSQRKDSRKPFLLFSFDCDTDDDAKVVLKVDDRLRKLGVQASYAVPGELLLRHLGVYRQIRERGAEFFNHGYKEHVYWNEPNQRWESCYFYDELTEAEVRADIEGGDRVLRETFGIEPQGFRTPHFGTYQQKKHLQHMYKIVTGLGYSYSTSTLPYFGLRYGAYFRKGGLWELPLTGSFSQPMRLMDSWNYYAAPNRKFSPADFQREMEQTVALVKAGRAPGALNYYADPAHIAESSEFFDSLAALAKVTEPASFETVTSRLDALKATKTAS